ncbi:FlgD immunoglobulin-like domain containing protein [Treponema putidum]|uniref:FlgD immunoglobulin-like domain containing protein n=1 Tax=Treponema putidum TaxID=221027 RepID=UPI003D91D9F4
MKKIQKIIFTLIYTLFVMAAGFAADFTWTGTQNTDWNDYRNWNKNGSPAALGETPAAGDDVIIPSTTNKPEITNNDVSIKSLTINSGAQLTISNGKTLTLSGNFTNNGGTFSAWPNTTVTFNGSSSKITGTGSSEPLFGNLTIDALPAKLELEKNIKIAGTFTQHGKFLVNDNTTVTFTGANSKIAGYSEPTFFNLTIASGTLKLDRATVKIKGAFTNNGSFDHNNKTVIFNGLTGCSITGNETAFYNLEVETNKTLSLDTNIIITNAMKNEGIFSTGTKTVTLTPVNNDLSIHGRDIATHTKFYKLKLINGGNKTLKIKNKISVAEKGLELEGGTASPPSKDPLTVSPESAGEINFYTPPTPITGTPPKGKYLTVEAGIPIAGGTYTVVQSKPQGTPSANWIFEDCLINMTWTGGNSTQNWNDYANWSPNGIPGIHTPVTIQTTSRYPKLTANVSAESVTVNSGAELDLTHYTIKKGPPTAKLTNNGTIKMTGSGDQLSWFSAGNNDNITLGNTSTVEYYDAPPSNANVWAGPYENLKVSGTRQNLRASSITVNKDFTVVSLSFAQAAGNFIFNGSSTIGGTGTISFYNLTVASSKSVTLNKDIAVGGAFINNNGATFNANDKNITFSGNFTNDGTFTPGSNIVTFNGTSTIGGNTITNFNNLSVASGKSVTLNKNITVGGAFINNNGATFNASTYNITLNGTFSNSGTFNSTDGTNNSFTFNGSFTNSGTFNANADNITFIGTTFTNSGTFAAGTNNTVTLNPPPGGTVTITGTGTVGDTAFNNLSLTGAGGKTLTINGKISVNGNLTLQGSGAADAQLLTIAGGTNSPGIELSADQTGNGRWLKVHTNVPMIPESGGKTYTVTESKAHEVSGLSLSDGNPKNWIFSGYAGPMTWKGTHSSDWNGWQNWQPCGIPGVNSDVTIPQKEAAAHYPKLTAAGAQAKSVTVNSGAELDLGGQIIKKGTGPNDFTPLTNNGTLKMTGTVETAGIKGQKEWFETVAISLSNNSTVEYYGNTPAISNIWAGPYKKLSVRDQKKGLNTGTSSLTVQESVFVASDVGADFTISAGSQNYQGLVNIYKSTTFSSTNAGGTVFESYLMTNGNTVGFSGNGKIETKNDIYGYGSINIISNTGGAWTSSGKIEANIINTQRNWTSTGNVTANGSITANDWTAAGNVTLKGNLTADQFNQTAGTLTFNGTGTPEQELKFTGAGNKNIKNLAINSSAKVKLGSNITIQGNFTNSGTFDATTVPGYTITLTNGADHTITGTGTVGDTAFHNLSLTGAGGKKLVIDKKISVLGNLTLTGTSTDKLTIEGVSTNSSIALTTANSAHGQYLKVRTNIPITGGTYTAEDSLPDGSDTDIQAGKPENWIFTNYNGTLTWKGSVDSNWNDRRNWEPALAIPGINTDVTIPQKAGPAHHYPILAGNAEANSITIAAPATLDLNGFVISDNSGRSPLTAHGTLKLKGTADQKNWFAAASPADKITLQNTSTVVYYDNSTANIWGGTYYKLQAQNRDKLITGGDFLTVEGTFKVTHTTPPSTLEIDTGNGAQHYKSSITATGINLSFKTASLKTMKDTPANLTEVTAANITVNGDWTSNSTVNAQTVTVLSGGSWTSKKGKITLTGNLDAAKFVQNEGDLIFNGTGNRQLSINSSDSKIKNLVINATASVKLGSNITIQGNFTNSGTFDATNTGGPPGYTVTLTNDGNHDITGSNTAAGTKFYNLICINAGGKQIKFNKKISVHGNLTLQGSSISNLLNISGTNNDAEIYVKSNQGTASGYECKWLGVAENLPIKSLTSSTYTCTTDESKPTGNIDSIIAGKPENWIFTNVYELRWTGEANDNNWNNPNNWRPRTSHAPKPTQFATVRAVAADNHPILGSVDYYAKKVEVVGTATLDLADKLIYSNTAKTATAELTAKGTLRLKGTDDQKTWFEHSNSSNRMTITQNSTVEYYSAPPTIKLWGGGTDGYNKLILNNIGTCTTQNSNLTVNGELTVKSSNVTINSGGGTQTYNGAINATGKDITLEGSTIATKHNITANKIKVLGDWNSNSGTITAGTDIEAAKWTSADGVITNARNNITVTGAWDSKGSTITANNIEAKKNWDSSGNVTSNGNIKVDNGYLWKPTAGDIKLKGNLTAGKFNQTGGTLTFNGSTDQNLHFTGSGEKNIFNLTIDPGAKVKLGSEIEVKGTFLNNGTFNTGTGNTITFKGVSFTNNGTFTAGATNTVTLNPTGNTVTITGTDNPANTKFSNLECTTSTTTKTLNISGKISSGDLILSGANGKPLTINGSNSAEIHLSNSHGLDSSNNAKGNYLKIYTGNVKIRPEGKYYVVKNSKDDSGSTISKNGWIFYKDSLQIVNSFAKPNDNHIYLLFDDDSLSTEEFHSLNALTHSLQITDGVTTYTSNLQTVHKEPSSYIPSGHSLWKIQLDGTQKFNPDDILKSTYQVSLNYFGTLKHKAHISDIGIDMVKPLTASNSIVLRNFNAGDNDPALPTLDVRVLAEKAPSSSNVILHFFSKNSAEHKFWHPDTIPSPPGSFANPQAGTTNYSPTLNGNLITSIIPSTDPSLKEGKVGQFMYVYNNWLPCARLRNPNDILSFDVWNFKIVGVRMQKGGVSIFDNVVNPHKGQSATIAAHLKKSGMLTIQIMTLDGNIVRTLTRSHHNAGDHFYLWDGRNNGGNPVASGMYFVRIAGPDIDEVRKILIIK